MCVRGALALTRGIGAGRPAPWPSAALRGDAGRRFPARGPCGVAVRLAGVLLLALLLASARGALNGVSLESGTNAEQILFAAPLAAYKMGARAASHRLAIIATRHTASGGLETYFCEYSLEFDRCNMAIPLPDLSGVPVAFSYSSFTPFGGRSTDVWGPPDDEFFCKHANWLKWDGGDPGSTLPPELVGVLGDGHWVVRPRPARPPQPAPPAPPAPPQPGAEGSACLRKWKMAQPVRPPAAPVAAMRPATGAGRADDFGPARLFYTDPATSELVDRLPRCSLIDCREWRPCAWANAAYPACPAAGCGPPGEAPFAAWARDFGHDLRWFRSGWERSLFAATVGVNAYDAGFQDEFSVHWVAALTNVFVAVRPIPHASAQSHASLSHFSVPVEAMTYADAVIGTPFPGPARLPDNSSCRGCPPTNEALKSAYPLDSASALSCPPFADDALSSDDSGERVMSAQIFAFWNRGVAHFASMYAYDVAQRLQRVVPRARLCTLNVSADLPVDAALLEPPDGSYTSASGGVLYTVDSYDAWPTSLTLRGGGFSGVLPRMNYASHLPPHASALAAAADPRAAAGAPVAYHLLLRVPLFPTQGDPNCYLQIRDPKSNISACEGLLIEHVFAIYSFHVRFGLDPSVFRETECQDALLANGTTVTNCTVVEESARLARAPLVLRRSRLRWQDNWIVQNERPSVAGPGVGALECKWAEGAGAFSFFVCPDEVVRLRRPSGFQSGLAGEIVDRLPLEPAAAAPSRDLWYSVPAAVYKAGRLYVVLERHTRNNTEFHSMDPREEYLPPQSTRRLSGAAARAPFAELWKLEGADGPAPGPARRVLARLPAGMRGAYTIDDYSAGVYFDEGGDPAAPFAEAPYVVFWAASPPLVLRVFTECPPGTLFNAETVFQAAPEDCVPLPAGRASARGGLLSPEEADQCPAGRYAGPGSTECLLCERGFYSAPGSASCFPCAQNSFSLERGSACEPCAANAYTQTVAWSSPCLTCSPGTYLPYPGASVCARCPASQVSSWGATNCTSCPEGRVPNEEGSACRPCPAGSFQPPGSLFACAPCPENTVTPAEGAAACEPCPAGSVAAPNRQLCLPCPVGTARGENGTTCETCGRRPRGPSPRRRRRGAQCPAGSAAPVAGSAACGPARPAPSRPDRRSCIPCRAGSYRSANDSACVPCPAGFFSEDAGSAECRPCPAGFQPQPDGQSCVVCPPGTARAEGGGACAPCGAKSVAPEAGAAACAPCAAGHVAEGGRCVPCLAGSYTSEALDACARCPLNSWSPPAATSCQTCAEGYVSNDEQTACVPCTAGSYRNGTMAACVACPERTYSPQDAAAQCLPCSDAQFCPVATASPVDLSSVLQRPASLELALASTSRRRRLQGLRAAGRALLGSGGGEQAPDLSNSAFAVGATVGVLTMPEIKTEEDVQGRVLMLFGVIAAAVTGAMLLFGLVVFVYLRCLSGRLDARRERYKRVMRLHVLFRESEPTSLNDNGSDAGVAKGDPWKGRTVSGSVFSALAAALVAVAVSFVIVQFAVANYQIIQSLNPGASPSASGIAGRFAVSASFPGYSGPCSAALAGSPGAGAADVLVSSGGFAGTVAASAARQDGGLSCNVTWECTACRVVSTFNVTVAFALRARLALAYAADFTFQLPQWVSARGSVATSRREAVFRGPSPSPSPSPSSVPPPARPAHTAGRARSAAAGTHFTSERDGRPRYSVAVSSADNRPAERDATTFTVCPPGRALERCEEERVAFVAAFEVAQVYYLVRRATKDSVLDMLANLASLSAAAVAAVGYLFVAYVLARRYLRRRHGLKAVETLDDLEREGETEDGDPRPLDHMYSFPTAVLPHGDGKAGKEYYEAAKAPPPPAGLPRARSRSVPRERPAPRGRAPPPVPSSEASFGSAASAAPADGARPRVKSAPSLPAEAALGGAGERNGPFSPLWAGADEEGPFGGRESILRNVVFLPHDR
eukprot:tig00000369_g24601.t1